MGNICAILHGKAFVKMFHNYKKISRLFNIIQYGNCKINFITIFNKLLG